jgi:hypothetical protein
MIRLAAVLCAIIWVGLPAAAWDGAELPPGNWLQTVGECVQDIVAHMTDEEKTKVRNTAEDNVILFHLGWGMSIRNRYTACGGAMRL